MPVELIREIADKPLPLIVTNQADIDKLRVLSAAGLVVARLPGINEPQQAEVILVTDRGLAAAQNGSGLLV